MKKDIEIPEVKDVYIAAIPEWNEDFKEKSWYAYLINDSEKVLEMAIVVSYAYGLQDDKQVKTSTLRHAFREIPAKSAVRVELLAKEVFGLYNEFSVSFFQEDRMYDKKYTFAPYTINEKAFSEIPVMEQKGCLLK